MAVYHPGTRRSRGGPSQYGPYDIDTETGAIDCPPGAESGIADALADKFDCDPADVTESDYAEDETTEDSSDGETTNGYTCGVNDCSRTVDSAEDTCWQH